MKTTTFASKGRDHGFSPNIALVARELREHAAGAFSKQDAEAFARTILMSTTGTVEMAGTTVAWHQGEGWVRVVSVTSM
jgi:hypothetical protein